MNRSSKASCPHAKTNLIIKKETYMVKGEPITIEAQVPICEDCKEELFVPRYDDVNLKKAYDIYRKKHNLLSSETIALLRQKYQLSQRAFAVLIGCTQATINRYEKGAIPDVAYNALIKLLEKPENVLSILEDRRNELDVKDAQKLEEVLERMISDSRNLHDIFSGLSFLMTNKPDLLTGFKRFDRSKVITMILFFASKQKNLYKTKLMKLLWYSDMLHFQKYVKSISGMRYVHQHYGPIPEEHNLILSTLSATKYIDLVEDDPQCEWERVQANIQPDLDCLSVEEIEVLEQVNTIFQDISAKEISAISHKEIGYIDTPHLEFISYEFAAELKAIN